MVIQSYWGIKIIFIKSSSEFTSKILTPVLLIDFILLDSKTRVNSFTIIVFIINSVKTPANRTRVNRIKYKI